MINNERFQPVHFIVCILIAIFVHIIYEAIVRPEALAIIINAQEKGISLPRHFLIIIKDLEQEICIILALRVNTFLLLFLFDKSRPYKYPPALIISK